MGGFSLWHILIFAVILLLLFGGNRFSAMMGDVAKGLKSFKQGMTTRTRSRRERAASRARFRRSSSRSTSRPSRAARPTPRRRPATTRRTR